MSLATLNKETGYITGLVSLAWLVVKDQKHRNIIEKLHLQKSKAWTQKAVALYKFVTIKI